MQSPRAIYTDFNELYDEDYVWAVVRNDSPAEPAPEMNDWVQLYDADGTNCWAIVIGRTPRTIDCKIDWSTWRSVSTDAPSTLYGLYQPGVRAAS